jgi:peptidyl-prolyl cis-trans isomerase SurA
MRKLISLLSSIFIVVGVQAQKDPIVMTVNKKPVTKSEFLQIYLKNNNDPKFDKASLDEYLEMFKKFKLKVAEAEAKGYDTIPKLKRELEGYRKQLATPYLIDSVANKYLVEQAYERMKTEIRASHILVRIEMTANAKDTLEAYNRILALKKRIEAGEDFATVAKSKSGSDDPSAAKNGGDLGYFTAFQMVYPFEEAAYNTAVGSISNVVRTRFGYHIIKVVDKRPARGTIKTAHLMVAAGKDATAEQRENAEKKINELYDKLKAGERWDDLVSFHSDDPGSNKKGGELPAFGSGTTQRMVPAFEDAAFALKNDGDISSPVFTDYGWHIIKRLEWKPLASFESMKKELQSRVNKDDRSKKTQDSYVVKLKQQYNYKFAGEKNLDWFVQNIDTTFYTGTWNPNKKKLKKTLFTINGQKITQADFATYLQNNSRGIRREENASLVKKQYAAFEKAMILNYEEGRLAMKYPEYKALVKEYHDGIILYEIMQDEVWNKAIKDTAGLRSFYEQNKTKYMWGKRVDATVYECSNAAIAQTVYNMIQNDTINSKHVLDVVNKDSELNLKVRMNKFEMDQVAYLKGRTFNVGPNVAYEFDGKFYVLKVVQVLDAMPKELNEARGMVTSDYQNYLEKTWLESLEKKHPIKVNFDVLYSLGK